MVFVMYTPSIDPPSFRQTPSAASDKSRDNGFGDLLRDRTSTDQARPPRTDELRSREPRPDEPRKEDTRPREPRNAGPEERRDPTPTREMQDTAPRREAEAKPDDGAPPKDAATADNSEGTESEQAQSEKSEISEQPDNAESETAAELPVTETNTVANDQETTPGVTTQTFVDGIPDKNEMLEGAAATPAAGAATDLTGTPEKTAAVTVTLETANPAGETSVKPAAADGDILNAPPAKVVPELAVTQQGTEPQATLSHNAAQNAPQSQIANIVESPASPATNAAHRIGAIHPTSRVGLKKGTRTSTSRSDEA